jgi:hypothetical protein
MLPDQIEMMESACEWWADENVKGDMATCSCGRQFKLVDGETLDPNPYAIPVCPTCFEEWCNKQERKVKP